LAAGQLECSYQRLPGGRASNLDANTAEETWDGSPIRSTRCSTWRSSRP